jgi:(p)ppGpp synthase/HD superfamily hydrolase
MDIDIQKAQVIIRYWLLAKEYYRACRALELAKKQYIGLRKDGKTPELYHPLALVFYLKTISKLLQYPEESIIVALIHDLGEDYSLGVDAVTQEYGSVCACAFEKITKKNECMKKTTEAYYDMMAKDPVASIVKAADRIHNHQSMIGVFSKNKIDEYLIETQGYVLPMIKEARRVFPEQEPAYENAKHILVSQIELIEAIR